jgi:hypothetical protein
MSQAFLYHIPNTPASHVAASSLENEDGYATG